MECIESPPCMKPHFFIAACLLSICGIVSSLAATTVRYPSSAPSHLAAGQPFQLVFDKAVVASSEVGKPLKPGLLSVSPDLKFSSKWIAPNVLECRPQDTIPFRASYEWKPEEGARFQDGSLIPQDAVRLTGRRKLNAYLESTSRYWRNDEVYPWESFFLVLPDYVPGEEALLNKTYFTTIPTDEQKKSGVEPHTIASRMRPALLKEVREAEAYRVRSRVRDREFQGKPDDTPVPGVYVVEPETLFSYDGVYHFVIPEVGEAFPQSKEPEKWDARLGKVAKFSCSAYYGTVSDQEGRLTMKWTQPVKIENVDQFFRDHAEFFIGKNNNPMPYDEKARGFTAMVENEVTGQNQEVVMRPDHERLAKMKLVRPDWYGSLPVLICGSNPVFNLKWRWKNVRSVDGQRLEGTNAGSHVEVRPENPSLFLDAGNNGIMSAGARKLKASVSNLKDLTVRGYRIREDAQHRTLTAYKKIYERDQAAPLPRTVTDKDDRHFLPAELLSADRKEMMKVDVRGKTEAVIGLDELFGGKADPGMYFIEVEGQVSDPVLAAYKLFGVPGPDGTRKEFNKEKQAAYAVQAVVQVTDLGVLHKTTADDMFVYGYSLATGKAAEKAEAQLLDADGSLLASASVEKGTVRLPMSGKAAYLRVQSGADSYLSPLKDWNGRVGLWSFDVETLPYWWNELGLNPATTAENKVFMFSDRNLYRPAETMHLKGIMRTLLDNKLSVTPVEEVQLTIRDGRQREVAVRQVKPSDAGTFDLDFTFPEGETGMYSITAKLRLKGDAEEDSDEDNDGEYDSNRYYRREFNRRNREFRYSVEVAEFKRNEFEVESVIHDLKPGDKMLKADVKATNFTGTPVSGGKVNWGLRSIFSNFYPAGYKDYRFGDYRNEDYGYWDAYYGYSGGSPSSGMQQQSAVLDANGKNAVEFSLDGQAFPRVRKLILTASVTNGNEQLIKAARNATWNPASVFVGVKNISSICRQGTPLDLRLIAVGLDGKPYAGGDLPLNLEVTRTAFQSTRYDGDHTTTVRNEPLTSTVEKKELILAPSDSANLQEGGKPVSIPTGQDGIYEVTLSGRDPEGREFRTAVKYWVYGSDVSPWEYHDGLKVKIIPDKQLYQPGDTARLLVQTPIEGEVVVTVEREKVLRSFTRTLTLDNPVIEIPLENVDAPNVYVSVFLVKGADLSSRKVQNPQLKLGYAALKVQPADNMLNVEMKVPAGMSLPGSTATVSGVVTDHRGKPVRNADVCLFAEDEGTLQVIGYRTPQPIRYFYADRPLSVGTWTTLEQILDEDWGSRSTDNKGMFIGGGDGVFGSPMNAAAQQAVYLREDFNPCAVWLSSIRTDEQGRFKASYRNPDTLTRYRVMAVVLAGNSDFGNGEGAYVVNKPIMLEPAPPFTATVGDSLNIPVTVSQTGTRKGKWTVTLKSNDIAAVPQPTQTLALEGNQPKTLIFNVKFNKSGKARLIWEIRAADAEGVPYSSGVYSLLRDATANTFEVVPPFPDLRELRCFSLSSGSTLDVPGMLSTPFLPGTPVQVTLSTSPLIYANGSVNFLLRYPYGCLEQLSSSTLPWIYEPLLAKYLPDFKGKNKEERSKALRGGIQKILRNQLPDGGLAYWQGGTSVSEYCPYAALVLTLARESGIDVPEKPLDKLYGYLARSLSNNPQGDLLGAWVLARAKRLPDSLLNRLLDRSGSLSPENRMYLALAVVLSSRPDAGTLGLRLINTEPEKKESSHVQLLRGLADMSLSSGDAAARIRLARLIMDRTSRPFGERPLYTTWSSGWDVMLLGEYLKGVKESSVSAPFRVDRGAQVTSGTCSLTSPAQFRTAVGEKAVLSLPDAGSTVYGTAEAHGRSKTQEDGAAVNRGFAVSRVYEKLNSEGKWEPAAEFAVGDLVRITLHVDKGPTPLSYVVMEDYLPSALEAVNPALLSQIPGGRENEAASQGDRWFYWNSWVSHREFLKDRVRFFADTWSRERFTARYLARVTKSGTVIAPSAKAELMYRPEVYGLSIPQKLTVLHGEEK